MFNPYDWYWLAADGRLFSSKECALIEEEAPAFLAWVCNGNHPTRWPANEAGEQTIDALQEVIGQYGLSASKSRFDIEKENAAAAIDAAAEVIRTRFITPGDGQAMTYFAKADEARRCLADPKAAKPEAYPFLAAEVGVTGRTLVEVAEAVDKAQRSWAQFGASVEAVRIAGKAAVKAAKSPSALSKIVSGLRWPG